MTDPHLSMDSPYGRLYMHPATREMLTGDTDKDLAAGYLVPSVTNVIGILEKPHLYDWYSRKATEAAMDVTFQHPGLIAKKPKEARKWLAGAARRHMNNAADLGTRVHAICERLANGENDVPTSGDEAPYVDSWRQFTEAFRPEYLFVESTVFGQAESDEDSAGYAGTADFFAKIGDHTVVGDLKTGRSIHTEAAIQLNALAAANELVTPDDAVVPIPKADVGIVVHLKTNGYLVHVVPLDRAAITLFGKLRGLWDFHTRNLSASRPLLMSPPLTSPDQLNDCMDGIFAERS